MYNKTIILLDSVFVISRIIDLDLIVMVIGLSGVQFRE